MYVVLVAMWTFFVVMAILGTLFMATVCLSYYMERTTRPQTPGVSEGGQPRWPSHVEDIHPPAVKVSEAATNAAQYKPVNFHSEGLDFPIHHDTAVESMRRRHARIFMRSPADLVPLLRVVFILDDGTKTIGPKPAEIKVTENAENVKYVIQFEDWRNDTLGPRVRGVMLIMYDHGQEAWFYMDSVAVPKGHLDSLDACVFWTYESKDYSNEISYLAPSRVS